MRRFGGKHGGWGGLTDPAHDHQKIESTDGNGQMDLTRLEGGGIHAKNLNEDWNRGISLHSGMLEEKSPRYLRSGG